MRPTPVFVALLALSGLAAAHNLHQSTSEVTATGKIIRWVITAHDQDTKRLNNSLLSRRIVVENNGSPCPTSEVRITPSPQEAGHSLIAMRFDCATPIAKLTLYYNLFSGERDHVHTVTVHLPSGNRTIHFDGMHTSAGL